MNLYSTTLIYPMIKAFIDPKEVTERVIEVVKGFEKVPVSSLLNYPLK